MKKTLQSGPALCGSIGIFCIATLVVLSGCGGGRAPVKVEPTLMSRSVDFTAPSTIEGNARPVYVLPVFSTGWERATVDSRTGAWKSGRYTANVVADGYWTTQEEAELSGKPYILVDKNGIAMAGSGSPREMSRKNTGGVELDAAELTARVGKLEQSQNALPTAPPDPDISAQVAARLNALANASKPGQGGDIDVPVNRETYDPSISVPYDVNEPLPQVKPRSGSSKIQTEMEDSPRSSRMRSLPNEDDGMESRQSIPGQRELVIPKQSSNDFSMNVPTEDGRTEKLSVRYVEEGMAAVVTYDGQTRYVKLKSPNEKIRVKIR